MDRRWTGFDWRRGLFGFGGGPVDIAGAETLGETLGEPLAGDRSADPHSEGLSTTLVDLLKAGLPERRLAGRLLAYWHVIAEDRTFPSWQDVSIERIGDDWKQCFLLDYSQTEHASGIAPPRLAHLGEDLLPLLGALVGGDTGWSDAMLEKFRRKIDRVLREQAPLLIEDGLARADGSTLLFRGVLLPLTATAGRIEHILGAVNGKLEPARAPAEAQTPPHTEEG